MCRFGTNNGLSSTILLAQEIKKLPEEIATGFILKSQGTDSTLTVDFANNIEIMQKEFEAEHQTRYGFIQPQKALIVELSFSRGYSNDEYSRRSFNHSYPSSK